MLVYQLPGAFRRLPRPSSPVIAKASTTCTYSLDPITLSTLASSPSHRLTSALGCHTHARLLFEHARDTIIKPSRSSTALPAQGTTPPHEAQNSFQSNFTSSRFLKNSRSIQASELNIQQSRIKRAASRRSLFPDPCFLTSDS